MMFPTIMTRAAARVQGLVVIISWLFSSDST